MCMLHIYLQYHIILTFYVALLIMKALTKVNKAYNLPKVDELWCYKETQHFKGKLHVINF